MVYIKNYIIYIHMFNRNTIIETTKLLKKWLIIFFSFFQITFFNMVKMVKY